TSPGNSPWVGSCRDDVSLCRLWEGAPAALPTRLYSPASARRSRRMERDPPTRAPGDRMVAKGSRRRELAPLAAVAAVALLTVGAFAGCGATRLAAAPLFDPDLVGGLRARWLGPATMSGRVTAIAGAPSDSHVLYVGAASGGVWKSTDGGLTWAPIFDDQPV